MHAYLAVVIQSNAVDVSIEVGGLPPRNVSYTFEEEAMALGEFVGSSPPFTSIELGVLKLHDRPSEFYDVVSNFGMDMTILHSSAVAEFARKHGDGPISSGVVLQILKSTGSTYENVPRHV
jgi:hypothetical protein